MMAIVNQVAKKVVLPRWEIVKFQILVHCYLTNITVSSADLDCLTTLGVEGEAELTEFCNSITDKNIFKSSQSARNAISKAEKKGLIVKKGRSKKRISLHPEINLQAEGNILLDFKFAHIESKETKNSN